MKKTRAKNQKGKHGANELPAILGIKRRRGRRANSVIGKRRGADPGPLTPVGRTGSEGHHEAVAVLTMAVRRQRAVDLFVDQQLTYEQIAKHLGVSNATVSKDLHAAFEESRTHRLEKLDHLRDLEVRRTHRNDRAILPQLYGQLPGDDPAHPKASIGSRANAARVTHERLTASVERRAKLLGLDAPTKLAMTDPGGGRRYHELSDEELDRMVAQRESALGIRPVIDVTPAGGNGHGTLPKNGQGEA